MASQAAAGGGSTASTDAPSDAAQPAAGQEKDMGSLHAASGADTLTVSDSSRTAIQAFEERQALKLKQLVAQEEQLKRVSIAPADVDVLVREFGWQKPLAERVLRMAKGDLKALLRSMCE